MNRQAARVEREFLPRFIIPRPFAGLVVEAQHGVRLARLLDPPRIEPPLAVERAGVAGHVGPEPHLTPAEGETAAPDPVDEGHEREARRLEHIFAAAVAFAQYRRTRIARRSSRIRKYSRQSKDLASASDSPRRVRQAFGSP